MPLGLVTNIYSADYIAVQAAVCSVTVAVWGRRLVFVHAVIVRLHEQIRVSYPNTQIFVATVPRAIWNN